MSFSVSFAYIYTLELATTAWQHLSRFMYLNEITHKKTGSSAVGATKLREKKRMSGINQYLKERLPEMGGRTWIASDIPDKKLSNAVNAFKYDGDPESIIGICDNTTFGSAKEGFLLTGAKVVYKEAFEEPIAFLYENIESIEYQVQAETNAKGKEKKTESIVIKQKDGETQKINYGGLVNREKLADILTGALGEFEKFDEQKQLQPIEDLSEELKTAYLKVIVNLAFDDDDTVDDVEFAEILQLMTRLKLKVESRHVIRKYISDISNLTPVLDLVEIIDSNSPDGMKKSLHISLVKDLISTHSSITGKDTANFSFLEKHRNTFAVSDEEIELAQMAIASDRKILDRNYTDKAITKSLKELSAKAGAVGVPLGAVYLSGSVVGLSAAGMTSGLATLGMGGALGLSSMATGIGAAIVLGVVAYRGVKHFTGSGVDEGDKRREIMLQDVIRQSQRTLNMVIEDINHLSSELSNAIAQESVTRSNFDLILAKLSQYSRASKVLGNKVEQAEADRARLKSPEFLDIDRLKALTKDHDKKKYYDMVLSFYEEDQVETERDGEIVEVKVHKLIQSQDSGELEQLGQIFEVLGYESTQAAIKGKLKGILNNDKA